MNNEHLLSNRCMCCKRELISWPTDKCRLLEYLQTWPVSGYQYSKRLVHTQVLITFIIYCKSRYFYTYWQLNIVGNVCGFLSSKHPNSIESYYTYITYVNPERLGFSNHSILQKTLVRYSDRKAHLTVYFTRCTFLHACLHNRDHISGSYQASN